MSSRSCSLCCQLSAFGLVWKMETWMKEIQKESEQRACMEEGKVQTKAFNFVFEGGKAIIMQLGHSHGEIFKVQQPVSRNFTQLRKSTCALFMVQVAP